MALFKLEIVRLKIERRKGFVLLFGYI